MTADKHWLDYATAVATAAAALAAAAAAGVSAYQAHIASDTEHRQLRAYISSIKISPYAWDEGTGILRLKQTIHNFGTTPAYDLHMKFGAQVVDFRKRWDFFDIQHASFPVEAYHEADIPPSGDLFREHDVPIGGHINSLKSLSSVMLLYGKLEFSDTFRDRTYTQYFCNFIDGDAFTAALEKPFEIGLDKCPIEYEADR